MFSCIVNMCWLLTGICGNGNCITAIFDAKSIFRDIFSFKPRVNIAKFMLQTKIRGFLWTFHIFSCHGTFECVSRKDRIITFCRLLCRIRCFTTERGVAQIMVEKYGRNIVNIFMQQDENHKFDDVATWKMAKDIYKKNIKLKVTIVLVQWI